VSGVKFAGTTVVLGLATALASLGVSMAGASGGVTGAAASLVPLLAGAMMLVSVAKLWFEAGGRQGSDGAGSEPLRRTDRLLRGPLKRPAGLRRFLGVAGGLVFPALAVVGTVSDDRGLAASSSVVSLAASIGGELIERYLFFRAVTRPRMPGGQPS
jgi:hypothetical protein